MKRPQCKMARGARGFTMIEAMVTLIVLSVGLLGVAALQLTGMRNNQGSAARTQATMLAYDIIDRMRANRAAAVTNAYNIGFGNPGAANGTLAGNDLVAWKQAIQATLPRGDVDGNGTLDVADGSIVRAGAGGEVFVVTIAWGDARSGSDEEDPNALNAALQFQVRTQLQN